MVCHQISVYIDHVVDEVAWQAMVVIGAALLCFPGAFGPNPRLNGAELHQLVVADILEISGWLDALHGSLSRLADFPLLHDIGYQLAAEHIPLRLNSLSWGVFSVARYAALHGQGLRLALGSA